MSHFVVLVAGDVEKALAPYHEFECTGRDDQYIKDVPVNVDFSAADRAEYDSDADYVRDMYGYAEVKPGCEPDLSDEHKYGYFRVDAEGNVTEVINRTNPNAKWDWYSQGGRWNGILKLKTGNFCNTAKKSEIDATATFEDDGYPFAACDQNRWMERGEMGWFAMVSNEKDQNDWDAEFRKFWDEIPDDEMVTIVDCHI